MSTRLHRAGIGNSPGILRNAEGDENGGGGGGSDPTTTTTVVKATMTEGTPSDPGKTFTQAEVDAIVKRKAVSLIQDQYGDYGDLKAKAKRLEEIESANATDLEKAVKKAREEGQAEVRQASNGRLVAAEARALAAEGTWRVSPAAVVRQLDLSKVNVAEDGSVDQDAIKSALADLAKAEPGLVDDGKPAKPKPDDSQGQTPASRGVNIADASGRELLRDAYTTRK